MDRGAWRAAGHEIAKSRTQLRMHTPRAYMSVLVRGLTVRDLHTSLAFTVCMSL